MNLFILHPFQFSYNDTYSIDINLKDYIYPKFPLLSKLKQAQTVGLGIYFKLNA